jgi:hypothetical protein
MEDMEVLHPNSTHPSPTRRLQGSSVSDFLANSLQTSKLRTASPTRRLWIPTTSSPPEPIRILSSKHLEMNLESTANSFEASPTTIWRLQWRASECSAIWQTRYDLFVTIDLPALIRHSSGIPSVNSNGYVNGNPNAPPPPPQSMQQFGGGAPQGYAFQYSNCTGRRKALLIGINYFGQRGQLRGCINDVKNMSAFLHENFGYRRDDMVILTDDQQNPMSQPTKQNILRAMHWLVKDARPNDSLFFHYSGKF